MISGQGPSKRDRYFKITMAGPEGTAYEKGIYNLELFLPGGNI